MHTSIAFTFCFNVKLLSPGPIAYRIKDTTIKSIDSHLRLNGVITDIECRDIPVRIRHAMPILPTRRKGSTSENGNTVVDDDGCFTSGCDELLDLMTTKGDNTRTGLHPMHKLISAMSGLIGYVKWPRIWQDTFTNITALESLHQRVSLPAAELIFDIEFPEEAAAISAEVGGRGFQLNKEDEDDLTVRNYRINLHGIKVDTRKMRRLRELDEIDGAKAGAQGPTSLDPKPSRILNGGIGSTMPSSRSAMLAPLRHDYRAESIPTPMSRAPYQRHHEHQASHDASSSLAAPLPSHSRSAQPSPRPLYPPTPEVNAQSRPGYASSSGAASTIAPTRPYDCADPQQDGYAHRRSALSLEAPRSEYSGRAPSVRTTASEDIKQRAMARW